MVSNFIKYTGYTLLGALAYSILSPFFPSPTQVSPYSEVVIHEETWADEGLTVRGSFTKNDNCTIVSFAVLSFVEGIPRYVDYTDLDGLPKDFNREAGKQGLNISIPVSPLEVDYIETRTRHVCTVGTYDDGKKNTVVITKVFSTHEPKQENLE